MLMPLGRLAPATIEQCDRRADLGGCCGHRIVECANEGLLHMQAGVTMNPADQ